MCSHINNNTKCEESTDFLHYINELLDIDDIIELLNRVVSKTPKIIGCKNCSIFVIPDWFENLPEYLINDNGEAINRNEITKNIIVLAASNSFRDSSNCIGKYYYEEGEGLTGWVFKKVHPLYLDDVSDVNQLKKYGGGGPRWKNKYFKTNLYSFQSDTSTKIPFVAIPIIVNNLCWGIIRISYSEDGKKFSCGSREFFYSLGKLISRRVEFDNIIKKQRHSIKNLIQVGIISKNKRSKALRKIIKETRRLLNVSVIDILLLDKYGETLKISASTEPVVESRRRLSKCKAFNRGEGLTGWIFNTSKPLIINDISEFRMPVWLDCNQLLFFSDNDKINEEDRTLENHISEVNYGDLKIARYIGIPLLSAASEKPFGILRAMSQSNDQELTRLDMATLEEVARNISLLLANMRWQELNNILIKINHEYGEELFEYVVKKIPSLIKAKGCSIFLKSKVGNQIELRYTNSELLKDKFNKLKNICYNIGEGKTGITAKLGRCLVINHYGSGSYDFERIVKDKEKYEGIKYNKHYYVTFLKSVNDKIIGLAHLVRLKNDTDFSNEEITEFNSFIENIRYDVNGIPCSHERKLCEEGEGGYSKSFLAVPLQDKRKFVHGVMRIPRSFPGGIFTDEDLGLSISIANRLASFMEREKISKERKENLNTLRSIDIQINSSFGDDNPEIILHRILEAIIDTLGFEFATIQLVDIKKNTIKSVLGKKNSGIEGAIDPNDKNTGWINCEHSLSPSKNEHYDIHVWLLKEYRKEFVVGPEFNPHFDLELYKRCNHNKVIRIYVPIIAHNPDQDIGTIEAGYRIEYKNYIDENKIMMVNSLANAAAIAIRNRNLRDESLRAKHLELIPNYTHLQRSPSIWMTQNLLQMERELSNNNININNLKKYIKLCKNAAFVIDLMSLNWTTKLKTLKHDEGAKSNNTYDLIDNIKKNIKDVSIYGRAIEFENLLGNKYLITFSQLELHKFKILFLNILHNAIKASPPNSTIFVKCYYDAKKNTKISIKDQGPGIHNENFNRIWDDDFSLMMEGWPEGSGLGLNTVKTFSTDLGWFCSAENHKAGGAIFHIMIPFNWRK